MSSSADMVEVRLLNGSSKVMPLTGSTTFGELAEATARKVDLPPDVWNVFAVFHVQAGYERLPLPTENVAAVKGAFEADLKAFKKKKKLYRYTGESYFVYKKQILGRRRELDCMSLPALTMLYYQARADVINSTIPTHGPDALELAGVQMHIDFGSYDEGKRSPGYLAGHNILDQYIPKRALAQNLHTDAEWEASIFQAYAEHFGKSYEQALRTYLTTARKSKFYGARVFHPASCVYEGRELPMLVQIVLTSAAIVILDPETRKTFHVFPYLSVNSWSHDDSHFFFDTLSESGEKMAPIVFETPEGAVACAALLVATTEAAVEKRAREEEALAAFRLARSPAAAKPVDAAAATKSAASKWRARLGSVSHGMGGAHGAGPSASASPASGGSPPPRGGAASSQPAAVEEEETVVVLETQRVRVRRRKREAHE